MAVFGLSLVVGEGNSLLKGLRAHAEVTMSATGSLTDRPLLAVIQLERSEGS